MRIVVQLIGLVAFLLGFFVLATWLGLIVTGLVVVLIGSGADINFERRVQTERQVLDE